MDSPTRDGSPARLYWLCSAVLALAAGLAAWWILDRPASLLALGWIPLGLFMAFRARVEQGDAATRTNTTTKPMPTNPENPEPSDARLRKEYWDRKLQAARQRRSDRHPTPVGNAPGVQNPAPVRDTRPPPTPQRDAPAQPPDTPPATLSPAQRQALARKLAPQVYQAVRKRAPDLPPEQVKKIVTREVQRIIARKLQAPHPASASPAVTPVQTPTASNDAPPRARNPEKPSPVRESTPPPPRITEPVMLDPAREQARQRAVAQILESARKNSRRNRVRRQNQALDDDNHSDQPLTLPRNRVSYRTITECMNRCNSNVERQLLQALIEEASLKPQKTELKGVIGVQIQVKLFKYNVDFLVDNRLAVEVVEFAYNNNKMSQIRDRVRGQTLNQAGFLGMQLSAEEIAADPRAAACKIIDTARKLATPLEDKPTERRTTPLAPPGTR